MAKKIEDAEVKKECPSCGLGVALDSTVCEFCGWDFEEEDEWILQIEKLERDLLLEKQKFEPGSVDEKIESTLHTPVIERIEMEKAKASAKEVVTEKPIEEKPQPAPSPSRERAVAKTAKTAPRKPETAPEPRVTVAEKPVAVPTRQIKKPQTVQPVPAEERVPMPSAVAPAAAEDLPERAPAAEGKKTRKVRVVRKVKQ